MTAFFEATGRVIAQLTYSFPLSRHFADERWRDDEGHYLLDGLLFYVGLAWVIGTVVATLIYRRH